MITKDKVIESLKSLPDQFSLDELMDKLIFIQKVENGLAQSEKGEVYKQEDAKAMLKKWSK
jgi:predicted transcriptional regulator